MGEDMRGKTIVEIGPSREGIAVLGNFAKKGALVIAIDVQHPGSDTLEKYPEVKFHKGAWEDISEILEGETVDIIFVHYMHPHPESGGRFERNQEKFEEYITVEMDKLLPKGGIFINQNPDTHARAFIGPDFPESNYKEESFIDAKNYFASYKLRDNHREELDKYEKSPGIGRLRIFQKV